MNVQVWPSIVHGGRGGLFLLPLVGVLLWIHRVYTRVITIILNCYMELFIKWWLRLPGLRITTGEFGFCKAYDISIGSKNKTMINIEELTIGIEWSPYNYRDFSIKSNVKNLRVRAESIDVIFSFTLLWRLKSSTTPSDLVNNDNILLEMNKENILLNYIWLQAYNGEVSVQPVNMPNEYCTAEFKHLMSPALLFTINSASFAFLPGNTGLTLRGRADKIMSCCRPRNTNSRSLEKLADMSSLKITCVWPTQGTSSYAISCCGTQAYVTQANLRNLLSLVDQITDNTSETTESSNHSDVVAAIEAREHGDSDNEQLAQVDFNTEDLLISIAAGGIYEMAALKISSCIKAEHWTRKSRYSCSLAVQGVCVSDAGAADPCLILSNELISASWRCSLMSTHVAERCLIMACESDELISLILRPDCFVVFEAMLEEYAFLVKNAASGRSTASVVAMVKSAVMEQYPRTQITLSLGGVNVAVEMDIYEQILLCTLEDLRGQCTRDAENLSCDLTIKDIEIEDRIQNIIAVRKVTNEEVQTKALHVAIIQDASVERHSIAFQQVYGEVGGLEMRLEESLLLKLLLFCGITEKDQLWGEEDEAQSQTLSASSSCDDLRPTDPENTSLYFEHIELSSLLVVFSSCPDSDLSDDLLELKTQLGIPHGMPPCVEKTKLEFERFLRTGIQYRSIDALVRDSRRHYMKEVGRQSAKILGSLHLLGNMTGLRDDIADGLAELRETGNYIGFMRHVKSGLADSYYKLADSWSPLVTQSPIKAAPKALEEPQVAQNSSAVSTSMAPGLFNSWASGLGSWLFTSLEESDDGNTQQPKQLPISDSVTHNDFLSEPTSLDPVSCSTPLRDNGTCDMSLCDSVTGECDSTDDTSSISSTVTSPSGWELMPHEVQRRFKGQEFVRRLKISLNETDSEEKFLYCLRLRHADPSDKLNALLTTKRVYFMKVGSPTRDNVVLSVKLHQLYKIQPKEVEDRHYLELVKRMPGIQRHNLPSPHAEDSPLVRCDYQLLAKKAASKIAKAKKKYEGLANCPCKMFNGKFSATN